MISKIKKTLRISFLLVCTLALLACGNEKKEEKQEMSKANDKPNIGLLIYSDKDPYIQIVTKYMKEYIGDRANLIIQNANNDQFTQNQQFNTLLADKVDVLAINLVVPAEVHYMLDQGEKTDTPLVFFNREPDVEALKPYNNAAFVGTKAEHAGILQGNLINKLWKSGKYDTNKDGVFQYIMIQANTDNAESLARTEHSIYQAQKKHKIKLKQVGDTLLADWNEQEAYKDIKQIWPAFGDQIELIVSNNDSMALGAIKALNEHGYNLGNNKEGSKFIPVIGVDAIPEAIKAIEEGRMSATVRQDGKMLAKATVDLLFNALENKDFLEGTHWQWDNSQKALRIPYAVYEAQEEDAKKENQ